MSAKPKLTDKQAAILKFVRQSLKKRGYPPTRQEIADEFGFSSPNAADSHLRLIELKGYIELVHVSRGIRVLAA